MPDEPFLPSLNLIAEQVAVERAAMDGHADSLDTKAGVVLDGIETLLLAPRALEDRPTPLL